MSQSQLGAACKNHGFFAVTNHGVPPAVIARAYAAAESFFALDEDKKMTVLANAASRGCEEVQSPRRRRPRPLSVCGPPCPHLFPTNPSPHPVPFPDSHALMSAAGGAADGGKVVRMVRAACQPRENK